MPHRRDPMKAKSAGANGARHRGRGKGTEPKDSTSVSHGTEANTPPGRKSPWTRLEVALADPDAGPAVRAVLEAGRHVDAEPGDGVAAFLPGGEVLLLLVEADGLLVRRNVPDDEVALFLADVREAA